MTREGAAVVVNHVSSADEASAVADTIESLSGKALAVRADIALLDDIRRLFRETTGRFGRLGILVVNAGCAKFGSSGRSGLLDKYLSGWRRLK